jgi:hypothetical protein
MIQAEDQKELMKQKSIQEDLVEFTAAEPVSDQILHNVLPSEIIQKFDYNTIFAWLYQPISFLMALSFKTQIYIVLVLLGIIFVIIPLIKYLIAKAYATIDPIKFEL